MNYIQLLRGAPITVLFALIKHGGQATTGQLQRATGYSQPTVSRACRQLCEAGICTNNVMGWTAIYASLQMVLAADGATKKSLATTTALLSIDSNASLNSKAVEAAKNILASCGIGEPMLSRLADLDGDFVARHVAAWKAEKPRASVKMLIHRLRSNDKPPTSPDEVDYTGGEFSEFVEH